MLIAGSDLLARAALGPWSVVAASSGGGGRIKPNLGPIEILLGVLLTAAVFGLIAFLARNTKGLSEDQD